MVSSEAGGVLNGLEQMKVRQGAPLKVVNLSDLTKVGVGDAVLIPKA